MSFLKLTNQRISSENILTLQGLDARMHRKTGLKVPPKVRPHQNVIFLQLLHCLSSHCLPLQIGCWRAKVPPGMFYLYELWNVHWGWRHLHAGWTHQTLLVGLKLKRMWASHLHLQHMYTSNNFCSNRFVIPSVISSISRCIFFAAAAVFVRE